ncbi:MAG: glycoside hydrolase family 15 protein [Acidobacteriaceae bacterium]
MPKGVEREGLTRPRESKRAPGNPGRNPRWSSGAKTAVGTSTQKQSRLWFTLGGGTINEIYFPDIDTANTRSVRFLITDGAGFFSDEALDAQHVVVPVEDGVPAYTVKTTCKEGRYVLKKEIVTDPARDVLLLRVRFKPREGNLRLFLLVDPQLQDQGQGNSAHIGEYKGVKMLFGSRDGAALAVGASVRYLECSCGYVGKSEGIDDLKKHGQLRKCYNDAPDGNIAMCAEIDLSVAEDGFVVSIGFGGSCAEAAQQARSGLLENFEQVLQRFITEWRNEQATYDLFEDLGGGSHDIYRVSTAVLETHQSKRYPGGYVASLSIPWGFVRGDDDTGGYHVLWPRDMVESAFGKLACGDTKAALEAIFYLISVQEEDGHWSQNLWLDGTPHLDSVQMDSTALPVMLACRLHREGHLEGFDVWPAVRKAVVYLLRNGPRTEEERWEALAGYSVFTIAVEVAALLDAAELADATGKTAEAEFLRETADMWNEAIDEYTYVKGTKLAEKYDVSGYYLRIAPPETAQKLLKTLNLKMPNKLLGNSRRRATDVVSPDALMLVRMGLRRADDPRMLNTLKVIDGELRYEMSTGPGWTRSSHDGYGEHPDGAPFNGHGVGRCWTLLAGERGHYAVAAGDRYGALEMLRTMARQTSECGMLPEQVWNEADVPERELYNGRPTGSGMPLAWAHAEYVKLLRSLHEGRVWDMPPATIRRYLDEETRSNLTRWTEKENRTWMIAGKLFQVMVGFEGLVRWTGSDGSNGAIELQKRPFGFFSAILPTSGFASRSNYKFEVVPADQSQKLTRRKVTIR